LQTGRSVAWLDEAPEIYRDAFSCLPAPPLRLFNRALLFPLDRRVVLAHSADDPVEVIQVLLFQVLGAESLAD
jgi:hypothetical protein